MDEFGLGPRLIDKVVIISGAGGGIGSAAARLMAAHGARVIVTDVNGAAATATAKQIVADGNQAIALALDVTSESGWDGVVRESMTRYGSVDVLVNNAGFHVATPMEQISKKEWDQHLAVNLTGPFLGTQRVVPEMLAKGAGIIINVCSVAAMIGGSFAHYSAAKGGVRSLTRTTAIAYAKRGIRANAIFPGLIRTNFTREALANPEIRAMLEASTALPRFGEPRDIAFCILFLASGEAAFATGGEFVIDGGVTAM